MNGQVIEGGETIGLDISASVRLPEKPGQTGKRPTTFHAEGATGERKFTGDADMVREFQATVKTLTVLLCKWRFQRPRASQPRCQNHNSGTTIDAAISASEYQ